MFGFNKDANRGQRGEVLPTDDDGPPDSHQPSGLCPRCNKQSSFDVVGSLPISLDSSGTMSRDGRFDPGQLDRVSSLLCRHCHQGIAVVEEQWVGDEPSRQRHSSGHRTSGEISYRGVHWWPLPGTIISVDVPPEIGSVYAEACLCLSAGCPRAAAVMARRTLEAITLEKGEDKGPLAARLNTLSAKGVLHPSLSEWVKEVRLIGNMGAHFDPIHQVSPEDARQLLSFIRELLKYLYELPAELDRRRSTPTITS